MYCVGLDLGRNGVGWSVVDRDGKLIRHGRHHHLWGITMFDQAETAKKRRQYRNARRRNARKKYRIMLLQEMLREDMMGVDPVFYARLQESSLTKEDRTVGNLFLELPNQLFLDGDSPVRNKASGNISIPIYHIRKLLIEEHRPADLRYVYLAIEHILKYRGHFRFDKLETTEAEMEARHAIIEIISYYRDNLDFPIPDDEDTVAQFLQAVRDPDYNTEELYSFLLCLFRSGSASENLCKGITWLISGKQIPLKWILTKDRKVAEDVCLSFEEDKAEQIMDSLENDESDLLYNLQILYDWRQSIHTQIANESLSSEMDVLYEQHRKDLMELKEWVKTYKGRDVYNQIFHDDHQPVNYNAYVGVRTKAATFDGESWHRCTQKEFYLYLEKILTSNEDEKDVETDEEGKAFAETLLTRMFTNDGMIKSNGFLPLQRFDQNRSISNQRQLKDLVAILKNQAKFWPSIAQNAEKIKMLCSFHIPFYVGPLRQNENSPFKPWIQYKQEGKGPILPWNFEERVDLEATAENFVENRISRCSFIPTEFVLPKHSMLYQEYEVLDELNRIYVNGKLIKPTWKRAIIHDVYCKYRHVTPGLIRKWFSENTDLGNKVELTTSNGLLTRIRSNLGTRIDMEHIFGKEIPPDDQLCKEIEIIVRWSTILPERNMFLRVLRKHYEGIFTDDQIQALANCKYRGWGKLSRMLLDGVKGKRGENPITIIEVMRTSNQNLMKAYYSHKYGFKDAIAKLQMGMPKEELTYDEIDILPCPPSVKRGIWTAVRILGEIEEVMHEKPASIFIRNMRDDNASRRKDTRTERTRYNRLKKMYDDYERLTGKTIEKKLKDELSDRKLKLTDTEYLYFSQLGYCMYSEKKIRLECTEEYERDYAIPLGLLGDMTLDNQVLVLRTENHRGEKDAMDDRVIQKMAGFWNDLYRAGLISGTKLHRLSIRVYDQDMIRTYLTRQLMETSRISMTLTDLLKSHYLHTHVYGINARLTENLRTMQGMPVIRDLNDMTQVFDAFLTAHIGCFADRYLSGITDESTRQSVILDLWKRTHKGDKNGIILSAYNQDQEDEGLENSEGMNAEKRKTYIRSVYFWKDPFFTYMPVIYDGKYYRETIYRPGSHPGVAHKENLPTETYGVHINAATAWMAIIGYVYKKKAQKELINVPVYIAAKLKENPKAVLEYAKDWLGFNDEKGYSNLHIIRDKIKLNQEVVVKGSTFYMSSASETVPARQLFLPKEYLNTAKMVLMLDAVEIQEQVDNKRISVAELDGLLMHLIDKMLKWYTIYKGICKQLDAYQAEILEMVPHDKAILIRSLIYCMGTRRLRIGPYLKMLHNKLIKGDTRLMGKRIVGESIILIDRSVTGIYSKRTEY